MDRLENRPYVANDHYTVTVELQATGMGPHDNHIPGIAPRKRLPGKSNRQRVPLYTIRVRGRWRGPYFNSNHNRQYCLITKRKMNIRFSIDIQHVLDYVNAINILMHDTLNRITVQSNLDANHQVKKMEDTVTKEMIDEEAAKYRRRRGYRRSVREYKLEMRLKQADYQRRLEHLKAMKQKEAMNEQNDENDD